MSSSAPSWNRLVVVYHAGGVYGYLAPSLEMPASQESDRISILHLVGRMITVVQNGQTIIDDQEIPGITGGALLTANCRIRLTCG